MRMIQAFIRYLMARTKYLKTSLYIKYILLFLAVWLFALTSDAQDFLKVDGKRIVNSKGEAVILRGMGLGGWMLQEGYMFQLSNLGQQYRIKQKIEEVVGVEKTKQFYNDWLLNHTTKK